MGHYYMVSGKKSKSRLLSLYKVHKGKYMKWLQALSRQSFDRRPVLKAVNPRFGTSVIPLDHGDEMIFFNYLQDKIHALYFEGSDDELVGLISELQKRQGLIVHKMNVIEGRQDRLMHLHLGLPNFQEIRRVIRMPH
jgi:hypothetical protein